MLTIGIDFGASYVKAAVVDLDTGQLAGDRLRLPTASAPDEVVASIVDSVEQLDVPGPVGCTFPGVVREGIIRSAANVNSKWLGMDGAAVISGATGRSVSLLNDADAAGIAEMRFGSGRDRRGVVMMLTFGTGIGSALFLDGLLVPNTELGHLEIEGRKAEHWASANTLETEKLGFEEWARRVERYLLLLEALFSPELVIIGGGVSTSFERFGPFLHLSTEVVPAWLGNNAGIVGAAIRARGL